MGTGWGGAGRDGAGRVLTGPPAGVTFPSGDSQEQLMRSLYEPFGVAPESLEYIEAHGTGTKVRPAPAPHPAPARAARSG